MPWLMGEKVFFFMIPALFFMASPVASQSLYRSELVELNFFKEVKPSWVIINK
jgi:hypothetical protein